MSDQPIRVLFVCTGNSARSQIGEALLQRYGGSDFSVSSAGTDPKGLNPYAVRALAEVDIDWSAAASKPLDRFLGQPFDYVITVCDDADKNCPLFTGKVGTRVHIGFPDPAAAKGSDEDIMKVFRSTRDDIRTRFSDYYRREISKTLLPQ